MRNQTYMDNPLKELLLPNGLTVRLTDETRHYFGGFYLVKLQIICKAAINAHLFADEKELAEARFLLGDEVVYRRSAEKMGVPSSETDMVLNRLVEDFEKHSLPYLSAPFFPGKLAVAQLREMASKRHAQTRSRFQS